MPLWYYSSEDAIKQMLESMDIGTFDKEEDGKKTTYSIDSKVSLKLMTLVNADILVGRKSEKEHKVIKNLSKFDHAKKLVSSDILSPPEFVLPDSDDLLLNNYYTFSFECKLHEKLFRVGDSGVEVLIENDELIVSGYTSVNNWISMSYLNKLLDIESVTLEGVFKVLRISQNDTKIRIDAQFLALGEVGVLGDDK